MNRTIFSYKPGVLLFWYRVLPVLPLPDRIRRKFSLAVLRHGTIITHARV